MYQSLYVCYIIIRRLQYITGLNVRGVIMCDNCPNCVMCYGAADPVCHVFKEGAIYSKDEVQGSDHIWQLSMRRYGVTVHQSLPVMCVMRVQYIAGMKARCV